MGKEEKRGGGGIRHIGCNRAREEREKGWLDRHVCGQLGEKREKDPASVWQRSTRKRRSPLSIGDLLPVPGKERKNGKSEHQSSSRRKKERPSISLY